MQFCQANISTQFANVNFDTGRPTRLGDYPLADETYAGWLESLVKDGFATVSPAIRRSLTAYYDGAAPQPRNVRNVIE